jgi:hypothetical protein
LTAPVHDGGRAPRPPGALAVALGDVRDGVAAIESFAQALGSRRVGPRELGRGIPEVQAGCGPLRAALAALEAAIAAQLDLDPEALAAVHATLAHASARVDELEAALRGKEQVPINARERLALDAVARPIAGELGAAVRLMSLLGAASAQRTTWIELEEVLSDRRASPVPSTTPVLATVELRAPTMVENDPKVVLDLLEFAVAVVVRAGVGSPRIVADRAPGGLLLITVEAAPEAPPAARARADLGRATPSTRVLDVSLHPELPREVDVLHAAARRAGFALAIGPASRSVTLTELPATAPGT